MIRHCCVRVGNWMWLNWHLYRYVPCESANSKTHWHGWQCVMCGGFEHQHRKVKR